MNVVKVLSIPQWLYESSVNSVNKWILFGLVLKRLLLFILLELFSCLFLSLLLFSLFCFLISFLLSSLSTILCAADLFSFWDFNELISFFKLLFSFLILEISSKTYFICSFSFLLSSKTKLKSRWKVLNLWITSFIIKYLLFLL